MNAQELWRSFAREKGIEHDNYEAWPFGAAPDKLADLVIKGIKTATASLYCLYEIESEPMPKAGDYSVILNSKGEAVCIIRTTKVHVEPFNMVSPEHAFKEGEGDRSLAYWRMVHTEFFTDCLSGTGISFSEDMEVLCEEFELVYTAE